MSKPFFLTRQTANLMEDFVRELKGGSSLFLLYGDAGVGKTRLLQELRQNRLTESRIHALDLKSAVEGDTSKQDRSAEIEALFASAQTGDVIIADHLEMALQKTRHQLFLSWSTDGVDKSLNLIIASNAEGFNELRQLAQQYQVRVQSFQLMPFSSAEVEAFLAFYLYPDQPGGRLGIPAPIRKQLSSAQGNVNEIIAIAERDGAQIGLVQAIPQESIRQGSRIVFGVLALFVVAVGVGWYFFGQGGFNPPFVNERENQASDVIVRAEDKRETAPTSEAPEAAETREPAEARVPADTDEPETGASIDLAASETTAPATGIEADDSTRADSTTAPATVEVNDVESESEAVASAAETASTSKSVEPVTETETQIEANAGILEVEPGTVPESEAVIDESQLAAPDDAVETTAPVASAAMVTDRFGQELANSRVWLDARGDGVGTIQILLLRYATFDDRVYYDFVDRLARGDVDVSQLRIFKTLTGGSEVYSVFYGEYDSREAAFRAIASLPQALRDTSPISRSVGGIRQEIRRLDE